MKEKSKGITLVALVVTIVVLLILAAVSISMLSGENGIIRQAQGAKEKSEYGELKEVVGMKITQKNMEFGESIEPYLRELENEHQGTIVEKVADDTYYVTKGKATVTVYDEEEMTEENVVNGKVEIWNGTGNEEAPKFEQDKDLKIFHWYIYTPAQLQFLANFVNNENKLTEKQKDMLTQQEYDLDSVAITEETVVYLMNDLDMGAREVNGVWETTENEKIKWTPIGSGSSTKKFLGTFEGNNHTIRGVYVNRDAGHNGILGSANTVKNLTVKNSYIKGGYNTGGIVGTTWTGNVENCHNINTTVILREGVYGRVGGIVGYSAGALVKECTNTGTVIGNGMNEDSNPTTYAGGIVGAGQDIENCKNEGSVTGNGSRIGGIAGNVQLGVSNCINTGKVVGKNTSVGGITGSSYGYLIDCINKGNVTGEGQYVGGVTGFLEANATLNKCKNQGNVTGKANNVGGIAGVVSTSTTTSNCFNTATVVSNGVSAGGIVGNMGASGGDYTNSKLEKCYNYGEIKGTSVVGGIIGYIGGGNSTVIRCYNKGKITGTDQRLGAIIGRIDDNTGNTINNLYYLSSVGIGAIKGADDEANKIMATTEDIKTYEQFLTWIEK